VRVAIEISEFFLLICVPSSPDAFAFSISLFSKETVRSWPFRAASSRSGLFIRVSPGRSVAELDLIKWNYSMAVFLFLSGQLVGWHRKMAPFSPTVFFLRDEMALAVDFLLYLHSTMDIVVRPS